MGTLYRMVAKRIALGLVTLFVISILIFQGVELLPGDAAEAILGQEATAETVAAFRAELKLDLPPHVRYFHWLGDFLQGDLGNSLSNGRPIAELIGWRLSNTVFLASVAAVISVPLALFLGMLAALYRYSWFDRLINITTISTISMPEFFIGYVLIGLFSVQLNIFPSISNISDSMPFWEKIYIIILPCMTLMLVVVAHMMRMTRASIINVLTSPFIEMAELKGLTRGRIIFHHAFPNALPPIINVVVLDLAWMVVGVVIVEVVFVYPGLGQLLVDSVSKRDLPVVQASGLVFAGTYILLNLTADVLSMLSNPKLRNPR
jgi:peptide/nickel transport system permease protein